jgi:anti-sigma regulatory factor (Ser/Thr protein kinase)
MRIASRVASLSSSYSAVPATVPLARAAVGAFAATAGASERQIEDIRLLVSEAVANVVQHAYDEQPGEVVVSANLAAGELWVLVADEGCGLGALKRSDGLGLGLAWMAALSDGLTLQARASGGLEACLRFDLHRHDGTQAPTPALRRSRARVASFC